MDDDQPRYMNLMHNETLLDFCHKTWLAYCKRFNTENDLFELRIINAISFLSLLKRLSWRRSKTI